MDLKNRIACAVMSSNFNVGHASQCLSKETARTRPPMDIQATDVTTIDHRLCRNMHALTTQLLETQLIQFDVDGLETYKTMKDHIFSLQCRNMLV